MARYWLVVVIAINMLVIVTLSANITLDLQTIKAKLRQNVLTMQFTVFGGQGSIKFEFDNLPAGWKSDQNQLIIPNFKEQNYINFSIRVKVIDESKSYMEQLLSINFTPSSIKVKSLSKPVYGIIQPSFFPSK